MSPANRREKKTRRNRNLEAVVFRYQGAGYGLKVGFTGPERYAEVTTEAGDYFSYFVSENF